MDSLGKRNKKSFILALNNSIQISFITSLIVSLIYLLFFKNIINILTDIEILKFISYKHILWVLIIPPAAFFLLPFLMEFILEHRKQKSLETV